MKKFLLSILSILYAINSINAQCSLDLVGTSSVAATSALSDMAVAPDGKTYVLAYNSTTKTIELRVAATIGSSWSFVASVPTVTNTTVKPVMEITKAGEIVMFVRDEANGKVGKVYHSFGGAITQIGPDVSTGPATDLSIAFSSTNEIFVAYTDVSLSNVAVVKKWGGASWLDIGTSGIASGVSVAHFNSLIIDKTNTPIIAYQDVSASNKITVRKYNGASWVILSTVGTGATTNSKLRCANNGDYYLGYIEGTNAIVQVYNGSVWTPLGSPVPGLLSTADLYDMELDPADVPFIIAAESGNSYIVAYKYNNEATWWQVPTGYINMFNSSNANISFDSKGAAYFAYVDIPTNNTISVKTLSILSSITQPTSTLVCNGSLGTMSVSTSGTFTPTFQWQTNPTGYFLNALAPYATTTTSILSFTANPSINLDKIRCVVNYGCRNIISNTATLTVLTLPSITLSTTNPSCFGSCNGAITANVSNGTAPYSYSWTPSVGTTSIVTGLCAGSFSVQVTDANACSDIKITNLISPSGISTSVSGGLTICNGASTTLTINAAGGTAPYTYTWAPGASLNSTNSQVVVASPTVTTTYSATTIDANACTKTFTVTVNVNPLPSITVNNPSICIGSSATLTATGADTYTWNPGNLIGAVQNVTPVSNTTYTVSATNTLTGCSNTTTALVTVNSLPIANAGTSGTLTCSNTTISLSGSGGTTYLWTGPGIVSGATTANPNVNLPGTYSLQVTSSGCTSTVSTVSVLQNTLAPVTTTAVSGVLNCTLTSVNASATTTTSPVTYNWTGSGITSAINISTITVNASGFFNYTVTNTSNGCSTTSSVFVNQNLLAPTATAASSGTITCSTNTISLSGLPATGVTYTWTAPSGSSISSGANSQNAIGTGAGTYSLFIQSTSSGCTSGNTVTVNQNTITPVISPSVSNTLTCLNTTVNAIVTTTTSPVTYNWTGTGIISGATTATITTNSSGVKNYTVTNTNNGCISTGTIAISQNTTSPSPTATNSGTLTCNTSTVNVIGTGGGTYLWSGPGIVSGSATSNPVVNLPGCYNLTVTAANGCTATATTCVSQNTITPSVTGSVGGTLTCSTSFVNAIASTIASPVTYNWSGSGIISGAGTATITVNTSGIKNYTVTNTSNGCQTTGTLSVSQNTTSPIGLTAGTNQTITCASPSVTLNGNISAPGNATFNWAGGVCGSTTSSITSACAAGIYSLTATDPLNGCTASSTVQVLVNAGVPVITSSSSGSLTCIALNVNAIVSTTVSTVNYLWTGPGIISGATSATATVNQPGNYSITVTNTLSGCSANSVVSINQDITVPTLTLAASPYTICAGSSSTLTATGSAGVTYDWLPGSLSGAIQTVSPISSSQYTATATNSINGCVASETIALVVNSNPTITVSGNMNICKGSSTNLTATGATSYTWDSGANTTSISVSPSITTTYTVVGEDANGCINNAITSVNIISSKDISGIITSTTGATTGDVTLYKYTVGLSQWDSITTVPFSSSYTFNNIDSSLYVVRAVPTATNIQVTYGDSAITWQNATVINHGCMNNSSQNIKLIALETFTMGPGILTGTITEAYGFGNRMNTEFKPLVPGTPIGGIVVKGGKNPGGSMFVQTLTDASGQYTLTGLPLNTGNESYFIFVDIPGLDTNGTYHLVISSGNTQYTGLNFTVDSMYINPIGSITSINSLDAILENNIFMYPNPTRDIVFLKYNLIKSANISIELYNVMGEKIQDITPLTYQEEDKYQCSFNTKDLSSGVYFVKFSINNAENFIKLIKTQ